MKKNTFLDELFWKITWWFYLSIDYVQMVVEDIKDKFKPDNKIYFIDEKRPHKILDWLRKRRHPKNENDNSGQSHS